MYVSFENFLTLLFIHGFLPVFILAFLFFRITEGKTVAMNNCLLMVKNCSQAPPGLLSYAVPLALTVCIRALLKGKRSNFLLDESLVFLVTSNVVVAIFV